MIALSQYFEQAEEKKRPKLSKKEKAILGAGVAGMYGTAFAPQIKRALEAT